MCMLAQVIRSESNLKQLPGPKFFSKGQTRCGCGRDEQSAILQFYGECQVCRAAKRKTVNALVGVGNSRRDVIRRADSQYHGDNYGDT